MGDYTVIAGELDEPGRETADVAFLPGFIDGYTNVGRPYWGWPDEDVCA